MRTEIIEFLDSSRYRWILALRGHFEFLGGALRLVFETGRAVTTRPFYFSLFVEQCYLIGVKSFSLVLVTAVSIGMVMSLQFGFGLERFGGTLYVPKVVGLSIMRELGPVMTCLMIAGRVGSGIAAELGSMKVTQQIDAIRALGTDPIKRLVIPRVLALLVMCPLLTVMADFLGIYGGMLLSYFELNIPTEYFFHEAVVSLATSDFMVGISKTFFFGFLIGITACHFGIQTRGGTLGVGHATTHSVVTSCTLIMITDIILTKVFWIFERM